MHQTRLPDIIARHESALLSEWVRLQDEFLSGRRDRISESQLRAHSKEFLAHLTEALSQGADSEITGPKWAATRELLGEIAQQRTGQGFSPTETAIFVFSFKQPLFARLGSEYSKDSEGLAGEVWRSTELLDKLGLFTFEAFQKSREEVIFRQQQELLELSTPVVELWHGVLALPLIGTLDSARTQIVMQNLLEV